MPATSKPRLAVWKFASCDGCQLTLLDCEDALLEVADEVTIAYFAEASRAMAPPPYDLSLVEGSITTAEDAQRILEIRRDSKRLVTIGACATAGGIQALRNFAELDHLIGYVYPRPEFIQTLARSTPIRDHVSVDLELHGCPIDGSQLIEVISAVLHERRPNLPAYSQCIECKRAGTICVMVAGGVPCLGSVTRAGCGNLCPPLGRGCYGCFGPMEAPETTSLATWFANHGLASSAIRDLFRSYNAEASPFRKESERRDAE